MLSEKLTYRDAHHELSTTGVKIGYSTFCRYCQTRFDEGQPTLANHPVRHAVSRKQIQKHIWSGKNLDPADDAWLSEKYPGLSVLRDYVVSFRIALQDEVTLETWISSAKAATIPAIRSFAAGLERDKSAVLNAAKFSESNAFLEGNVNRLKMIKRSMFGRAGLELLTVKVIGQVVYQ